MTSTFIIVASLLTNQNFKDMRGFFRISSQFYNLTLLTGTRKELQTNLRDFLSFLSDKVVPLLAAQ